MAVVDQDDNDRQALEDRRRELLLGHLEAAVAVDADHGRVRACGLGPDRRGNAVAHRAEPSRGDERARAVAQQVLHRPHLVLADAGRPDDVVARGRQALQRLEHRLWLHLVAALAVAKRRILAPAAQLSEPWLRRVRAGELAQVAAELRQHALQRPDDGNVGVAELVDLCRVDVEMDDGGARRERGELAGDPVVEAGADGDEHVALVECPVRPLGAVHPRPPEVQLVRLREPALRHQGRHDRQSPEFSELEELRARICIEDAAADVEDGALRGRDSRCGLADLARVTTARRPPARKIHRLRILEVELGLLHVPRDIHQYGPTPAGAGDVERGLDHVRQLLDVFDEPRVLDDRDRDTGDVALLESVRSDQVRAHLTRDADERCRVHPRIGDRGDEIRCTRSRGRDGDADAAGSARVALRHVAGALLVPREDVANRRAARERVVGGKDRAAGKSEDDLDALGLQRAEQGIGAVHPHASSR